jgi:5'-3' exonuclease
MNEEAVMFEDAILLVDLSSIAHPIWHVSQSEPDPNATSIRVVARVRALATAHPHAAVCVDTGRSFRREVDPTYKANRPESDATLQHQIALAVDTLKEDGFPVWAARGFEADDIIATATAQALERGHRVLIASADKDLLQLVGPSVCVKRPQDGAVVDEAGVLAKLGVTPRQVRDYLSLCGDSSDNIKGANGIGPKGASKLLALFGSIDAAYDAIDSGAAKLPPATLLSLQEFRTRKDTVRTLVSLRPDVPITFEEVLAERVPKDVETFLVNEEEEEMADQEPTNGDVHEAEFVLLPPTNGAASGSASGIVPVEFERQLEPRSFRDAQLLAKDMFQSRMFSAYGNPPAVLSAILVGRELGMPAMASLRSIHVVEGRHTLSAALMVALVLKSGLAEFFEPVEFDHLKATFVTKRKSARKEVQLTHTIEMAVQAGLVKPNSNWTKTPTDMLVARAQSRLARMVYPDLMAGLYSTEELAELGGEGAAA